MKLNRRKTIDYRTQNKERKKERKKEKKGSAHRNRGQTKLRR